MKEELKRVSDVSKAYPLLTGQLETQHHEVQVLCRLQGPLVTDMNSPRTQDHDTAQEKRAGHGEYRALGMFPGYRTFSKVLQQSLAQVWRRSGAVMIQEPIRLTGTDPQYRFQVFIRPAASWSRYVRMLPSTGQLLVEQWQI